MSHTPNSSLLTIEDALVLPSNPARVGFGVFSKHYFIRSFLTRIRTPCFKYIARGLDVPYDVAIFLVYQRFTGLPCSMDDMSKD